MSKEKTANYTPEQTAEIIAAYKAGGTGTTPADFDARDAIVQELCDKYGREKRSVRGKLATEKVYISRTSVSGVTGETPEKKEVIAQRLANAVGTRVINGKEKNLNPSSLEKMNKPELYFLLHVFNEEIVEESEMDESETDKSEMDESETDKSETESEIEES